MRRLFPHRFVLLLATIEEISRHLACERGGSWGLSTKLCWAAEEDTDAVGQFGRPGNNESSLEENPSSIRTRSAHDGTRQHARGFESPPTQRSSDLHSVLECELDRRTHVSSDELGLQQGMMRALRRCSYQPRIAA